MEIKTEKQGDQRKYTINGKVYTRIEDVPAEYQSYLRDEDNNGIPDVMEPGNMFRSFLKGRGTVPNDLESHEKKLDNATYTSVDEDESAQNKFLLLKIMGAIAIGSLLAILYYSFFKS